MNTKRFIFWGGFIVVLALIVWGLIAADKKQVNTGPADAMEATSTDHVLGTATKVTLIEYSDFQCPACEAYYPWVTRLYAESSSTMRLVYRHFPLPQHANAMPAALASEAAAKQGKFWPMYDELFSGATDWVDLADASPIYLGYAKKIGLDIGKYKADLASSTLTDKITADKDGGIKIGINATPTFFVNGKAISNPKSYAEFKAIIDSAAQSSN